MPAYKGTIAKISTDPRSVKLTLTDPAPPPAEGIWTPLTDDQWTLLCSTPAGASVTINAPQQGVQPTSVSRP